MVSLYFTSYSVGLRLLADVRFPLTLLHILTLATGRHVTGTGCEQCFNMVHIKGIEKIDMNDGLDDTSPDRRNLFFDWLYGLQFELTNKYLTPLTYLQRAVLRRRLQKSSLDEIYLYRSITHKW